MFSFLLQGKVGEMMAPVQSQEAQLLIAIQNRQHDKIRELLEEKGVGANNANDRGVRPMHIACQSGNSPLVQRLLELGADIITADKAGNTPLHYASKGGHTELVKMLVGQGALVEKRNNSKLTAYDVATDHVIRQFLLPLQLKAEAGNPDYAVHTMGITSDTQRNYEQYGTPDMGMGMGMGSQPYGGHQHGGGLVGDSNSSMDAALGALMQAPSVGPWGVPRPGGMAPPPRAYLGGGGGFPGTPSQQAGPNSPPGETGSGSDFGGYSGPTSAASASGAGPLNAFAPPRPPPPPQQQMPGSSPPFGASPAPASPPGAAAVVTSPPRGGPGPATPTKAGSSQDAAPAGPGPFPGVAVQLAPSGEPGHSLSASSPSAVAAVDPVITAPATSEDESLQPGAPGAAAATSGGLGDGPVMSTVDLSSRFQTQAAVSRGAAEGAFVGGAGGAGASASASPPSVHSTSSPNSATSTPAPPPARPGVSMPGTGPRQTPAEQNAGGKKFKPIKADGFHSSASDKALQERYGHTKIVREFGAPPTAAQLGCGGPQPMGGASGPLPMPGPLPFNGYSQQAYARPQYAVPPHQEQQHTGAGQGQFGQPCSGGGSGGGGKGGAGMGMPQQNYGQPQPSFGHGPTGGAGISQAPPPPRPSGMSSHRDPFGHGPPGGASSSQAPPPPRPSGMSSHGDHSSDGVPLPMPGGYAQQGAAAVAGFGPPPPPPLSPGSTTVVAADSTSSAVL